MLDEKLNISFILSKSFYFPGQKCYMLSFKLLNTHILILTRGDAVEKIIVNMHRFSVLQQNFNCGDITLDEKILGTW